MNNADKQINKAKELASQHLGIEAVSAQLTTTQGCFSKILEVSLEDGRTVIIQFRIEALDTEPFISARKLLGDLVPIIEAIHDPEVVKSGVWPFYMKRIPGKTWVEYEDIWDETQRATCSKSLGRVFSRCFVEGDSGDVVDAVIIPNLRKIQALAHERNDVKPFSAFIAKLIDGALALKNLPLFFGHLDINEINVLVDESAEITGIVDWELSPPLQPFGVACYCIQYLAGEIIDKVFRQRPEFEAIDRGFWLDFLRARQVRFEIHWKRIGRQYRLLL